MPRMLRMLIVQVMITGLVLITWGVASTAVDVFAQISQVRASAGDLGGLQGAVIMQPTITPLVLPAVPVTADGPAGEGASPPANLEAGAPALSAPALSAPPLPTPQEAAALAQGPFIEPVPTPLPPGAPDRLVIPTISLDAPVHIVPRLTIQVGQDLLGFFYAPDEFAAGWHQGSAFLGEPGNTVLSGHHNVHGSVFARLNELQPGDEIQVYAGSFEYRYRVSQVMKFEERGVPLEQRIENARWILPSTDERLTLVTCWPITSNTHRLIVVAQREGGN